MSADYTTAEVRKSFQLYEAAQMHRSVAEWPKDLDREGRAFDRWLNAERARIWDEGYGQGRSDQADHSMYHQTHTDNPYRSTP